MSVKKKSDIEKIAREIAKSVLSVDTDYRGFLYKKIGDRLRVSSQHHTAHLFEEMAREYGIDIPGGSES